MSERTRAARGRSPAAGIAGGIAVLVMMAACSGNPPEITEVALAAVYVRSPLTGEISSRLRLYVQASDPDGADDLATLYLFHDASELFWRIPAVALQRTSGGWLGTYSFALPRGWEVPEGPYRMVLEDAAGETAERTATVAVPPLSALRFPTLRRTAEGVEVDPESAWVLAFSAHGELLSAGVVASVPWERVRRCYVYTVDARYRVGLASGPYEP